MDNLDFNKERHEYRLAGTRLPSVTQVISPLQDFSKIDPDVLERARQFGIAVHLACELWDQNILDIEALDPQLVPYLEAWKLFRNQTGLEIEGIEVKMASSIMGFAGKADRIGRIKKGRGMMRVVSDIKTGDAIYDVVGLQLAAYKALWNEANPKARVVGKISVRLGADGKYKLDWWNDTEDIKVFMSLLKIGQLEGLVRNWQIKHGGRE